MKIPNILCSDGQGRIVDVPHVAMAGQMAREVCPIRPDDLIELPPGSQLYFMPGRKAVGIDRTTGRRLIFDDAFAVAAHIPPSYTHFQLAAYTMTPGAPRLPLFSYTAVGWWRGKYYVPAVHIDRDKKHLPTAFNNRTVRRRVETRLRQHPHNRLLRHHGEICALQYDCPNAKNLFLNRWEAPVAVAAACNAQCIGCISWQPANSVPSPQRRLDFVPTVDEIVELAVPHLESAERAIVSFGQGCEGEPLLRGDLIEQALREIRRRTDRGVLHMNTNGSKPDVIERLFNAGLDSVRVSLNSAQPVLYERYYRPNHYSLTQLKETLILGRTLQKFTSLNYFVFPGITDSLPEVEAMEQLIRETGTRMIQWRNFNIDPEWYLTEVCFDYQAQSIGVPEMMHRLQRIFPSLQYGYLNKDRSGITA